MFKTPFLNHFIPKSPVSPSRPRRYLILSQRQNGCHRKKSGCGFLAMARCVRDWTLLWRPLLNIVGLIDQEPDFLKIYRRELLETPNIHWHGYLNPGSEQFNALVKRCFAFIAPTATESISTAVATLLQVGLYPLLSADTGVDLPIGAG